MNMFELMNTLFHVDYERKISVYRASRIHTRKSGPGRSVGMKPRQNKSGDKIARQAFNGVCGLRCVVGAAGRLALEGKLGKNMFINGERNE